METPKPNGGVRTLGIPTVVDRFVQQLVLQVLQRKREPTFSKDSYGFRPGRSAQQAVAQAQTYIAEGYSTVVDIDLEKSFDRVHHDRLMCRIAMRVTDKRVLWLILLRPTSTRALWNMGWYILRRKANRKADRTRPC